MAGNNAPNWLGLLQWSLKYQDGTAPSEHTQMTEEKRIFLENAMKEMVRDEPERLYVITNNLVQYIVKARLLCDDRQLSQLQNSHFSDLNDDLQILDDLEECAEIVHQIDMANVFINKYKGLQYLLSILENKFDNSVTTVDCNYGIRALIASIIGTLAQNNDEALAKMYAYPSSSSASASVGPAASGGNVLTRLVSVCGSVLNTPGAEESPGRDKLVNKVFRGNAHVVYECMYTDMC